MSRVTRSGTDSEARSTESEPRNASANREHSRTATRTRERRRNRLLGGLLIVGLWEFVGRLSATGLGIAPLSSILVATVDLYASGAIYGPLVETVVRLLIGYALAVAVGVRSASSSASGRPLGTSSIRSSTRCTRPRWLRSPR